MNVADFIATLAEQGVELWFEGARLRFRAPKGALTEDQRTDLSTRRFDVIAYLRGLAGDQTTTCRLSYAQKSLWFLHQQAPDSAAYNVPIAVRIVSEVDIQALAQALQALVDRHAVLRTTYHLVEGEPVQRISALGVINLDRHFVSKITGDALRGMVEADYRRPFDLVGGPVFRASLYTRDSADHILLLTIHHIAVDGLSLMILFEELLKLYGEGVDGSAARLGRTALQYSDYVNWQAEELAGAAGERAWLYWRQKLAELPKPLSLPTDYPRPVVRTYRGASLPFRLEQSPTLGIKDLARQEGTTPFVVMLASFQAFLFRITGSEDLIVGTPTLGRGEPEFMRVVGDFVNSVPLRGRLRSVMTFRELIAQVRTTVLEALDAQEFPLSLLVERLNPLRDPGRSPLFDSFFVFQNFKEFREIESLISGDESGAIVELGQLLLGAYALYPQEGAFDLALDFIERVGAFQGVFKYRTDLFKESTIRKLAADYIALLEKVAAEPETRLAEFRKSAAEVASVPLPAQGIEIVDALSHQIAENAPGTLRHIPRLPPLQLTQAQRRFWFIDRIEPDKVAHNIAITMRLDGPADLRAIIQALEGIMQRHEVLRMRIGQRNDEPYPEVATTMQGVVRVIDLTESSAGERGVEEGLRLSHQQMTVKFDLIHGPLVALLVVRPAPDVHLVTICMYPIVADQWSLSIAVREFSALYNALVTGQEAALAPLLAQYADYAAWEDEQIRSGVFDRQLLYWKSKLSGAPALLDLPTDRPRPPAQSYRGGRVHRILDLNLLDQLRCFSQQHDATLFMTMLAAWKVLLHRYSGQDDIVIGSPMANRGQPELENLIGLFANNLALRTNLAGKPTFTEFLGQVRLTTIDALDHRDIPFDVVVEGVNPLRSVDHAPLFQVMFALHDFPVEEPTLYGLKCSYIEPEILVAPFDLSLEMIVHHGVLHASLKYAADLFDLATIERMHDNLGRLLREILIDPSRPIQDLPILSANDECILIKDWNSTALDHDRGLCVHQLFESSARKTPDAPAVVFGDETFRFCEIEARANRLARLLQRRGVNPGELVGIFLDRNVDMPVAMAAVLKAGAAYVPLDATHPPDRLRYILEDADVACVITVSGLGALLADAGTSLILLDEIAPELNGLEVTPPLVSVHPDDLAYVIYTSGSTGQPKGVQVEHRNVVSFLAAMRREPGFVPTDVLLAVTTLSFDIAGLEIWLPLSVGAKLVIASNLDVPVAARLIELMEQNRVTVMQATPATWRLLLAAGWRGKPDLKVLCGGEALPRDLAAALIQRVGQLWNMYGPTEATIWSTVCRVVNPSNTIPIGRAIANTKAYVVDVSGVLAPIGARGELCIAGEGVARGYWNRPELTAEKFRTIALPDGCIERVYYTGDIARFRNDGQLEFLGRRDNQIKLRGYRIELGEIEAILASQPSVRECAVIVREDEPGDQRLVGYVVASEGSNFDPDSARAMLRTKLPAYMVPGLLVCLPTLPLTPNGKIDHKALLLAVAVEPDGKDGTGILMNPVQRRVADIWRELLRINRVGLHDNFFDLGGQSMLAVKLHEALQREFESDLTLVELFQHTTVAKQADRVSSVSVPNLAVQRARARAMRQTHV